MVLVHKIFRFLKNFSQPRRWCSPPHNMILAPITIIIRAAVVVIPNKMNIFAFGTSAERLAACQFYERAPISFQIWQKVPRDRDH